MRPFDTSYERGTDWVLETKVSIQNALIYMLIAKGTTVQTSVIEVSSFHRFKTTDE